MALNRPIAILVLVAGMFFFGINAARTIKVDIFPKLDLPVIYVSHPYGGYTPAQMEAFFTKPYVNVLLFVNGVKSFETQNVQGLMLMKLTFYEGTNMAQAAAEVTAFCNRIQSVFPPGATPPFIIRFDASTLPVGQLVLSSPKRTSAELLDMASSYIRPSFTSIPGLVSPPPFGGSVRGIIIKADPELLRAHNLTPDQLVELIRANNQATPSGNVRIGNQNYLTPINTLIKNVKDFENLPLVKGQVSNLYLRDVATVEDGADAPVGYALVNGRRSVYLNAAKSADASTWEVVQNLKAAIPRLKSLLPEDVELSYEFDQSAYVINAVESLLSEGIIGAILTGLMVLLFLGDVRGALIVILTIPASLISSVLFLNMMGQTINIMTLSGLALAIGILVDESTVTIENIHRHLEMGKPKALAIWHACREIAFPKLLILLCILAVFAPAFTMKGIPGSLFLPLALSIGFSMVISFLLSQTFVPVMANWLMKEHKHKPLEPNAEPVKAKGFEKFRLRYRAFIAGIMPYRKVIVLAYLVIIGGSAVFMLSRIGKDVLPKVNGKQFQVRLRAPDGTRIERTEEKVLSAISSLEKIVGKKNIDVTSSVVGMHPSLFSISPLYMFMAGPHEAVLQVSLAPEFDTNLEDLKENIRVELHKTMPEVELSFEPIELTDKILSQGSPTPIEVRFVGRSKPTNEKYAKKLVAKLKEIPFLRDVQIGSSIRYPVLKIDIDRVRAAQLGLDVNEISRVLTASTSSSRYTEKNFWIEDKSGFSFAVQVQLPENRMNSVNELLEIPLMRNATRPVLGDVATISTDTTYGQNDNYGALPALSVTANIHKTDLGKANDAVRAAIASLGELPRGLRAEPKGMVITLTETLDSLQNGLIVAIVVIFLMLAANFQSFNVSFTVLVTVPAVVFGALLMLILTGSTLNLQSYMGIIMSVGVSIANSVLLITSAEELRLKSSDAQGAAIEAAGIRIRPILMTGLAMIAGMLPMASGMGEGGDQTSPLGRAVIGGLLASTFATLIILPLVFSWIRSKASIASVSLDPENAESKYYVTKEIESGYENNGNH